MIFSLPTDRQGALITSTQGLSATERQGLYVAKLDSPIFFRALPRKLKWCKTEKRWVRKTIERSGTG